MTKTTADGTSATAAAAIDPAAGVRGRRSTVEHVVNWLMPAIVVFMVIYFSITTSTFLTTGNLSSLLTQNAATFIVAALAGMLLMAGYVDLSVGSTLALAGVVAGITFNAVGVVPGIIAGLGVGIGVGLLNGALIGYLGLSPIVVTIGGLAAWRAYALFLSPDQIYGFPAVVGQFAVGKVLGITYVGWMAIIVAVLALFVMAKLPLGRRVQAIGVNERAAFLVGVRVKPIVLGLYVAVGAAVGLAALLQIARLDSAPSGTLGEGFEVTILTAVLLGGIPFTGGRGEMWRVILGVVLLAVLRNGLILLNYGPEVAGMVTGAVLVLAAGLQALSIWVKRRA
ncbi:MAG: ABC transporter permease [Beutenbergiaceae bacterium]